MSTDFKLTLRSLARSPGFALVAILTLAVGIGGTTAVFSAVNSVLIEPLPYQQPGQLVRLYQSDPARLGDRSFVSPVHFLVFRDRMSSFAATAAIYTYSDDGADIGGMNAGSDVRRIRVLQASADYFDVLRVHPLLGRAFRRDEEWGAPAVILSQALWQQQFRGDRAAVGQTLTMSGVLYTIVGVMAAGFTDPVAGAVDAWVPIDLRRGKDPTQADNHFLTVLARLRPGAPLARAQAELDAVASEVEREFHVRFVVAARLYPLKDDTVGSSSRALEIMLGAAGLLLALVCVNIANLLLVRGSERSRELAVRSALGAGSRRLASQMVIESVTLAAAGGLAGLAVARAAMATIVAVGAGSLPRLTTLSLDGRLLAFALAVSTLSALGFGLVPALRLARTDPGDALREQGRASTGGRGQLRLREWLVVSQVAFAFVLLVGAGLLVASFQRLRQLDLGVRTDDVLVFDLNLPSARYDSSARARFYEAFADRVSRLPGVRAAGGVSKLPATGPYNDWGATANTGPLANTKEGSIGAQNRVVSGNYFRAVGIPLLSGRYFDATDDAKSPTHVIVSKALAARLFPGVSAVGQRLSGWGEIVGVVGDVAVDPEGRAAPFVYHAHAQFAGDRNWALTQVIATTVRPDAVHPAVRRLLGQMDPLLVMYRPTTMSDAIGRGEAARTFTRWMLLSFAGVALAVAALGLFGVLSYGVRLRAREFAIRMALGARAQAIRGMVLRQGLVVTMIGTAIGIVAVIPLSRLMVSLVFRVSTLDPRVILGAAAFMTLVAMAAAYVPARGATAVEPRSILQ